MKIRIVQILIALVLLADVHRIAAQGTAFTYQGRLTDGANPANGSYDLKFSLFDTAAPGGNQLGSSFTVAPIGVTNGLFTVTLDFGGNFSGAARWLEIGVRTNGSVAAYATLLPWQQLTPTPYAITAENIEPGTGLAGTYSSPVTLNNAGNSFNGAFNGNGAGLASVNAATLGGYGYCSLPCYWNLTGNSGSTPGLNFLGTTDNKALEIKVNSSRALRLEPNANDAPNFIGGSVANNVVPGTVGGAIGGGGANGYIEGLPELLNGYVNVGANQIGSDFSTIGGGGFNVISNASHFSWVGGGILNTVMTNSPEATIGGGFENTIQSNAPFATIGGGILNSAAGIGAFVGGGGYDGNFFPPPGNSAGGSASAIVGGIGNTIPTWDHYSSIGGGFYNQISPLQQGIYAVNTLGATIGGGGQNTNYGSWATIPGGLQNVAQGSYSFAAGQNAKALHNGAFVWADYSSSTPFSSTATNQFLIRASGGMGININNPTDAALSIAGKVRLNDNNLYLRPGTDVNHGLGYYYGTKSFAGNTTLDGPVLFGYGGGILGTEAYGTEHIAVQWSPSSVTVNGTFNNNSDRNAKQDFTPLSKSQILDKVLQLPISEWSYKVDATTRHVGPMAQDFYSVFGIGTDERHIAPIDEGGVALAAIQGLNQKEEEKDSKIQNLEHQNTLLEKRLNELEQLVQSLTEKK